jgi:hypothetical protein
MNLGAVRAFLWFGQTTRPTRTVPAYCVPASDSHQSLIPRPPRATRIQRTPLHFPRSLRDLFLTFPQFLRAKQSNSDGDGVRCRRGRCGHRPSPQAGEAWLGRGAGCRGKRPSPTPLLSDVLRRFRIQLSPIPLAMSLTCSYDSRIHGSCRSSCLCVVLEPRSTEFLQWSCKISMPLFLMLLLIFLA